MSSDTLVKIGSIIIAIATLITELVLLVSLVWSFATTKPVVLSVTLLLLSIGFGVFVYSDYKKFFKTKVPQ